MKLSCVMNSGSDWTMGCTTGEFFPSLLRPDRLWGPPNLLINGFMCSFSGNKAAGAWSWPFAFI